MSKTPYPHAPQATARAAATPPHDLTSPAGDPLDGQPGAATAPAAALATLLFVSGACALLYQVTWLRELRLVFGATTQATAAVLAIFMGGLGVGSAWLGRRADRDPRPLRLYARLEIAIGLIAVATPLLLWLVRLAYLAMGGTTTLGPYLGTVIRILLAALAIGAPTVLLGGTLPAAARAFETEHDRSRGRLGMLYGVNTLGAVCGALLATFLLLEWLGARATILLAATANVVVGLVALRLAASVPALRPALRLAPASPPDAPRAADRETGIRAAPRFVLLAAALVGAAFFVMEIVWYRMMNPLLGGSTYSIGIVLAVALLGVGLGGAAYGPILRGKRPTLALFALSCTLEALLLAVPFALGDRIAVLAVLLRPLGSLAFAGHVAAWGFLASLVVLPPAIIAGFQFPLLLGLLGEGRAGVGRHVGLAYAWNTAGAILGSLAGGFGLLPALGAPGVWRVVAVSLAMLGSGALVLAPRRGRFAIAAVGSLACAIVAVLLVSWPVGPTAAWRHSSIGAGRVSLERLKSRQLVTDWLRRERRAIAWERDGRESSIAISNDFGVTLMVGGKSDGSAIAEAGTQVMCGMLGALLHPRPRDALVIGLGTGSTAGWLGRVPSITHVDVAELEPAVMHVTEACAPVNQNVLHNPKVKVRVGDGREILLTSRNRYDLIVSEPSNPYRAGVASLYTSEFYCAAASRLTDDGLFLQWVQIYELDFRTLRTVYATVCREFPHVETWATLNSDLLLVASRQPIAPRAGRIRERLREEPFRGATQAGWRTASLEGVLAHFVGNDAFGRYIAGAGPARPNTDDRTILEYQFARQAGGPGRVDLEALRSIAVRRGEHLPAWVDSGIDWDHFMLQQAYLPMSEGAAPTLPPPGHRLYARTAAMSAYLNEDYAGALRHWRESRATSPYDLSELAMVADVMAEGGDPAAEGFIELLRRDRPVEADLVLTRLQLRRGNAAAAAEAFEIALSGYRHDPWAWTLLVNRALPLASEIAAQDRAVAGQRLFAALEQPFAAYASNFTRIVARLDVARVIENGVPREYVRAAIEPFGENGPWVGRYLATRADSYARLGDPRAAKARQDLLAFVRGLPPQPSDL